MFVSAKPLRTWKQLVVGSFTAKPSTNLLVSYAYVTISYRLSSLVHTSAHLKIIMQPRAEPILRPTRCEETSLQKGKSTSQIALQSKASHEGCHTRPRYAYQPLRENQIRVVELHPGERSDIMTISLHHEIFEANPTNGPPKIPRYEALSYVWGSMDTPERVLIDHSEININSNLDKALKRFRRRDASRFMWIDALCID
ncbi:hypothetical protein F5Y08DRAFT_26808 [Xylaria arbuscula]|nr:hypothetical protein F5Y08DRAFT_26808 [Xylaria arbuscula]